MNVLVVGGTGFIGQHLCGELDEQGHDVTALSRDPDPSNLPDGVEMAMGDVTAYDGGNERHDEIHRGGAENCLNAAEEAGVERFVHVSALGADVDGPTHYIRAKGRAERLVRSSELDWVVFRPSVVFGEGGEFVSFTKRLKKLFAPGLPVYPLPGGGRKTRFQPVWVSDLVSMLVAAVEDEDHVGEVYEIGGPEVLTLREITRLVYDAEGKSVSIVPLPMGLAGLGLKTLSVVPGFPMGGDQYRSLQFDNTTADNDVDAFGVEAGELRMLSDYLGVE
ncbi:MAG: complex I NDUFA9 subunit family protein [Halobacteriales archaeon SW_9_67_25]|nr:MAG: complex I NDUFA9 subunit family protein [Halobacteriales archaeon SW_9_67_25]